MNKLEFIKAIREFAPDIKLAEAKDIADTIEARQITDRYLCGILSGGRLVRAIKDAIKEQRP